jgi:hypothetical protein
MHGSYSLKAVLPALVPELSYKDLVINNGGLASTEFFNLYYETDEKRKEEVRKQLLEYCGLDTMAMVEILKVLEKTANI